MTRGLEEEPLEAVVFDLDGVLIDSEPLMRFAFETSFRKLGLAGPPPIEAYLEHMGESFPRIMDHLGLPHALWEPYLDACRRHPELVEVFPQTRALLSTARRLGLRLGILTGKDRERTLATLERFQLAGFFQVVLASDQLRFPKPHPEGMQISLARLGTTARRAAFVGDSVNDILCAQAAGVRSVAVTWGTKPERVRTLCTPDHIVDDWGALAELLQRLRGRDGLVATPGLVEVGSNGA
jgi:3-amino-5-hydroxybenzoic acid synthesis related protein